MANKNKKGSESRKSHGQSQKRNKSNEMNDMEFGTDQGYEGGSTTGTEGGESVSINQRPEQTGGRRQQNQTPSRADEGMEDDDLL